MATPKTHASIVAERLRNHRALAPLLARDRLHQRLLAAIRKQLPGSIGAHCLACVLNRGDQLTLYADTAAWASQLRFYQPTLLPALERIAPIQRIRLRVLLSPQPVEKKPVPPRIPPPDILTQLEHNAASVEDPAIRRSLEALILALRQAKFKE